MFRKAASIAARPEAFFEELFLQRYDQLLEWALHLTDHRAAQAEDLVHDAFVQLTLSPPDFKTIENLDGYLFVVLRNLQRSQMQRAQRGPLGPEALVDFDSAVVGLKAQDPRQHWQAIEELQLVCRFACARKESSKAGSALILRFFHGYYPGEVAALLCVSRPAIKELLRMARGEAKLFLDDPTKLSFLSETPNKSVPDIKPGATSEETLAHLRQAIFAARQGRCLERKHLAEIYEAAQPALLTVPLLAHLVSCPDCLDEANRLLGLPSLSERDPNDMLGPDCGAQSGSGTPTVTPFAAASKTRARQRMLKKYRQRLREVYEHEPQELRIAVNGFVLARQEITAAVHKQTLGIEVAEDLSLIEVLSEQGHRLLALHVVPPPDGSFEQQARAEFSEGRTLTAQLSFCGSWPHLEIIYDCGVRNAECGMEETRALPSLLAATTGEAGFFTNLKSAISNPQSAIRWLLRPVTVTVLLAIVLLTVVVGQKLGWWFAAPKPASREVHPGKITPERAPTSLPKAETNTEKTTASPLPSGSASAVPSAVSAVASATLEIEVLGILRDARADLNEQIEVNRAPNGKLRIEGILETDQRKAELLAALAPIKEHPAVELRLLTVAEALRQEGQRQRAQPRAAAPETIIEQTEITATALPVEADLRRHFATRGVDEARMEAAIRGFAATTVANAHRVRSHATTLKRLAARFSGTELEQLDPQARGRWRDLLRHHARSLLDETLALRAALAPIFGADSRTESTAPFELKTNEGLRRACDQLTALCLETDRAIGAAFTLSPRSANTTNKVDNAAAALRTVGFHNGLHRIEHLAAALSHWE
jgi:RNA polymerase sigma factor (sigma-70 family)